MEGSIPTDEDDQSPNINLGGSTLAGSSAKTLISKVRPTWKRKNDLDHLAGLLDQIGICRQCQNLQIGHG